MAMANGLLPPCVLRYFLNRKIYFDETFWVCLRNKTSKCLNYNNKNNFVMASIFLICFVIRTLKITS
jgi:hypothetical protein